MSIESADQQAASMVADKLLRHPAVSRAWIDSTEANGGPPDAFVTLWSETPLRPGDIMPDVAEISAIETRFLYEEIFVDQTYLQAGLVLRENATVFDVGANIGMFSLFVHYKCPTARMSFATMMGPPVGQ